MCRVHDSHRWTGCESSLQTAFGVGRSTLTFHFNGETTFLPALFFLREKSNAQICKTQRIVWHTILKLFKVNIFQIRSSIGFLCRRFKFVILSFLIRKQGLLNALLTALFFSFKINNIADLIQQYTNMQLITDLGSVR